jgi:hypothetical protein
MTFLEVTRQLAVCKGRFPHTMLFPCHAVLLRLYIVSFPFDLRSAAVFDSHISCRSHAVPLPCHEYAFLKVTCQGHGRVTAWEQHGSGIVHVN